jgi:hypothetical protein
MHVATAPLLCATWLAYMIVYTALVWHFDLLNSGEKQALAQWARKLRAATAGAFGYGKG